MSKIEDPNQYKTPLKTVPFDPTKPFVTYRCANKKKDCGVRWVCQPREGEPWPPPDPTKFWCSSCGIMVMDDLTDEGPQLGLL